MIEGLDHVQLAMPPGGEEHARAFYRDVLGLEEIPKPSPLNQRGGLWLAAEDLQLHLGIEQEFRPARKAHPALLVRDLEAMCSRLAQAGAPVERDDSVATRARAYTEDPFGNRIELIQDGDGFSQR